MNEKTAQILSRFCRTDREVAEVLLDLFGELREKARDSLEAKENPEMRGRAKQMAELLQLFDDAEKIVQRSHESRGQAPGNTG